MGSSERGTWGQVRGEHGVKLEGDMESSERNMGSSERNMGSDMRGAHGVRHERSIQTI